MSTATLQPTNATTVTPLAGESCEDFTIRAHQELMQTIPDPYQRNQVVWDAWEAVYGHPERERIESKFGTDRYEHVRDVEHWQEHEAQVMGPDGQPAIRNNDVNRLISIIRENNMRIADTDSLPGLIDKHTLPPGADDKGKEKPRNLGYAGPFRLGMTGRIRPRFAIYGDEHHRKDRLDVLADRPQRSVEVLTLKANGRSYISPIACLSEAPRLPLPVQYSAINDDGDAYVVDRYSAEPVASFPGGGNTYIPGGTNLKRRKNESYSSQDDDSPNSEPQNPQAKAMLDQEDLKQIADAIMSTPQMQFVTQLMQQGQPGDNNPVQAPPQPPHQGPAHAPAPAHGAPQPGSPVPAMKEPYMMPGLPGMAAGMVTNRFSATDPNDDEEQIVSPEQYQALIDQHQEMSEQYQAMASNQAQLMQQVAELKKDNAIQRAKAADADRKTRLHELYSAYPHFIDIEQECGRCLYSAGSQMNDDQFESHCDMLENYAAKAPVVNSMVPRGEMPYGKQTTVETAQYEAQVATRSTEIYQAALAEGKMKTPDQCWAEAERELQQ